MAATKLTMKFLGAAGTVTGSCTLLTFTNVDGATSKFLVDAGSYQGERYNTQDRNKELRSLAPDIKGIFITHAHIDHTGLLPTLVDAGFKGKVYCTKATHDILIPMLYDAMWVDGTRKNPEEIEAILRWLNFYQFDEFEDFVWGQKFFSIATNLQVGLLRAGHVLGAVSYYFRWLVDDSLPEDNLDRWKVIHFSGDVGSGTDESENSIMLKPPVLPFYGKQNAYIVLESTYGTRPRPLENTNIIEERTDKLYTIIQETFEKGGSVLIPAFAFNRSQEILLDIQCCLKPVRSKKLKESQSLYYRTKIFLEYLKNQESNERPRQPKLPQKKKLLSDIGLEQYINSLEKNTDIYALPPELKREIISKLEEILDGKEYLECPEKEKILELEFDKNQAQTIEITELKTLFSLVSPDDWESVLKDTPPDKTFKELDRQKKSSIINKLKETYLKMDTISIPVKIHSPLISRLTEEGFLKHLCDSFMTKDGIIKTKYLTLSIFSRLNLDAPTEADDPQTFRKKISDLNEKFKQCLKLETPAQNQGKSKKQQIPEPIRIDPGHVIVTSSGMCDEGKVMELLPKFLSNPNHTIILTGYQAEKTNGRLLKGLASGKFDDNLQAKYNHHLKGLDIRLSDVCCRIEDLSPYYSSHADQTQLVNYVHGISGDPKRENIYPTRVFLNHGTDEGRQALAEAIKQRNEETNHNIEVVIPSYGEEFEL